MDWEFNVKSWLRSGVTSGGLVPACMVFLDQGSVFRFQVQFWVV